MILSFLEPGPAIRSLRDLDPRRFGAQGQLRIQHVTAAGVLEAHVKVHGLAGISNPVSIVGLVYPVALKFQILTVVYNGLGSLLARFFINIDVKRTFPLRMGITRHFPFDCYRLGCVIIVRNLNAISIFAVILAVIISNLLEVGRIAVEIIAGVKAPP